MSDWLSDFLSVWLSVCPPAWLSVCLSIAWCVGPFVRFLKALSLSYLSPRSCFVPISVRPPCSPPIFYPPYICLTILLPIYLSNWLSVCPSVCLTFCLTFCLSVCLSVGLSVRRSFPPIAHRIAGSPVYIWTFSLYPASPYVYHAYVCLSFCLSICPTNVLSVCWYTARYVSPSIRSLTE